MSWDDNLRSRRKTSDTIKHVCPTTCELIPTVTGAQIYKKTIKKKRSKKSKVEIIINFMPFYDFMINASEFCVEMSSLNFEI